jgi:CBS domain-containing membrane protein
VSPVSHWLSSFIPATVHLSNKERLRSCIGALFGIALTAALTRLVVGANSSLPLLIAPMGASTVLLFAVPASPLAQPWSLIGGNLVAAFVGVTCAQLIHNPLGAATVAVPLAIAAMFYLRCIHPPSGAVALTAVLGGPAVHGLGYGFLLAPVGLNSAALLVSALVYHHLTGHRYPHRAVSEKSAAAAEPVRGAAFTKKDLDDALTQRGELLDVEVDDLQALFREVEMRAYRRHMDNLLCADVMTKEAKSVTPDTTADAAWKLLHAYRIKALPVIDEERHVIGIVTQMDFLLHAKANTFSDLATCTRSEIADPHMLVRDMMSKPVKTASLTQPVSELVPMFANYGHHHLPVVDAGNRLQGIVTQANLVTGLYQKSLGRMLTAT